MVRVQALDAGIRNRLADSLAYLAGFLRLDDAEARKQDIAARLANGRVSPWVFALYSKAVADLSNDRRDEAKAAFLALDKALAEPAPDAPIAMRDAHYPAMWWDHYAVLLDTDPRRPFHPSAPEPAGFEAVRDDIAEGLALLDRCAPEFAAEVRALLPMIVLASSPDDANAFNGASTFFVWGGTLLNCDRRRSPVVMVDLLVHESSHVLLFGVSANEPLVLNPGDERYASPLRRDERPLDGIFHAAFVATRVHLCMRSMIASGKLGPGEAEEARARMERNGASARGALETLFEHARFTDLGRGVATTLRDYWSSAGSA
jgi:HEXXH motif-containing protein